MRWLALGLLLPALAWAGRPRTERDEHLVPSEAPVEAPRSSPSALLITADLGVGSWASSLVTSTSFEASFGFGTHLSRHLMLTGQVDFGLAGQPSTRRYGIIARFSLSGLIAWDVMEIIRRVTEREIPLELGPEFALGLGMMVPDQAFALPVVQVGAFARYVFSPGLSLGLRLRGVVPFWNVGPFSFHGDRSIQNTTEPSGLAVTFSLIRSF